jgi:hypothetical protein
MHAKRWIFFHKNYECLASECVNEFISKSKHDFGDSLTYYCQKHQQNMLLYQYLLMIPMYDMSNNIYVYRDYETRFGVRNKPFH